MTIKTKKPAAPEAKKFPRKMIPCASGPSDDEKGRAHANLVTSPEFAAYRVIGMMQPKPLADEIDAPGMLAILRDQAAAVQRGDLAHAEAMLINQASALQSLFVRLSERAMEQTGLAQIQTMLGLALKAQSQCRATLQTLVDVKYPKQATFIKQANIANQQQVNNGTPTPGELPSREEKTIQSNELLEDQHGKRMDTGKTSAAIGADPQLETVGAIHRA